MNGEQPDKNQYDVVSVSRRGSEKRANYIQNAGKVSSQQKNSGQFVKVFADVFLKKETGDRYYF
jgi:hypothetical protein